MFSKRIRPPDIDLARVRDAPAPKIHVQSDTDLTLSDDDDLETLQLSDSDSSDSSPGHRSGSLLKINPADDDIPLPDDITKDLAALQQLRKSVKTNLRLRPIRSRSNLPKINLDINSAIPSPFAVSKGSDDAPLSAVSPALSAYYTPISETPHSSKHRTPFSHFPPLPGNIARPISPKALHDRLRAPSRPLLIDTRPLAVYQAFHLRYSVNIAIPSLILKRYRKSGAGLEALDTLRQFTTTEQSRARWDALMSSGEGWDGNAVIYDGEMDVKDKDDLAWAIIPIVAPLLGAGGSIEYLEGGLSATRYNPDLEPFIVTADGVEVEPIGTGTPQHATLFPLKNRSTPLSSPLPPLPGNISSPISANTLYNRLRAPSRPLLIDTRPLAAHQAFHLRYSVSIAIPSLILKRCRKPGGGLPALSALRQFVTTEQGKERWDELMGPEGGWDGNVVIYDDEMDVKDKDILGVTAWAIMPVIAPLLRVDGRIEYLEDGLSKAGHDPDLTTLIVTSDEADIESSRTDTPQSGGFAKKNNGGLFQLDTHMAFKFKKLPEIEPSSSTASNPPSPPAPHLPPSPLPMMPSTSHPPSVPPHSASVADSTPSPPPSSIGFRRPAPPRRPSVPGLRRLDTRSAERLNPSLPKLSVRTKPMRSATLHLPPSLNLNIGPPQSPSHLQLMYSTHSPPLSARFMSPSSDPSNYLTPYYTPPHTPGTPRGFPPSPSTARPDLDPPTTEEAFPMFAVSTILPNFLYLGPELTTPEHVAELKELGVKRILNIAAECDDDMGLGLKEAFKYCKIPMRDTVEEDGIAKGVREACDFIGKLLPTSA